jgi:hypothetical protein
MGVITGVTRRTPELLAKEIARFRRTADDPPLKANLTPR